MLVDFMNIFGLYCIELNIESVWKWF